jgi:hypothetical protein
LRHRGPGAIGQWAVEDYRPAIMPAGAPQPHQP